MNKRSVDLGYWKLPLPEDPTAKYRGEWERIPKIGNYKVIPFGYVVDPDDEDWLLPVPKELELLELAKEHLKKYSYEDVAAWLTTQSGRSITGMGLKVRVDIERKRKKLATIKRFYAKRLGKILAQIDALETQRTGAKKRPTDERGSSETGSGAEKATEGENEYRCPCCGAARSI